MGNVIHAVTCLLSRMFWDVRQVNHVMFFSRVTAVSVLRPMCEHNLQPSRPQSLLELKASGFGATLNRTLPRSFHVGSNFFARLFPRQGEPVEVYHYIHRQSDRKRTELQDL